MSGHTAGPWVVVAGDHDPDSVFVEMSEGATRHRYLIAGWAETAGADAWLETAIARSANARLIAAAPGLLDACEALCKAIEEDATDTERLRDIAAGVRALAIAKATGEEP